jgi:EamA domain-containing membrane protein RarD
LSELKENDRILVETTVLQGVLTSILFGMEVVLMKNQFDFKDMLTFGLFLLALLTFVFTFCR